ncbi:hypothetical protein HDU98_000338 [Podochytrium sp. JEL0797]|nr:hypothetical protein HDU98_000338 [Podochytrium sp. JEL0797]
MEPSTTPRTETSDASDSESLDLTYSESVPQEGIAPARKTRSFVATSAKSSLFALDLELPYFGRGNAKHCVLAAARDGPPVPLRVDGMRKRVHPTKDQIGLLETFFAKNPLPTKEERQLICSVVNINTRSVQHLDYPCNTFS